MRLLSAVHRWTGAFLGLLLALLGLSGAILVWEGDWISLPGAGDAVVQDAGRMAEIAEHAAEGGGLSRITFASEEIGLHQVTLADGGGAYVRQDGAIVSSWASQWERPELWLFDFHHHLFAGETGETITGIAGLAGLAFIVTGMLLWWRTRRQFRLRLWPERMAPGPIVKQHRDLGVLVAPLLLLSLVTGVLMLFQPLREALIGKEVRPDAPLALAVQGDTPIETALLSSAQRFPGAQLRRLSLPRETGDPISVRMKQAGEWTPNGRTQLTFDSATGAPLSVEDPLAGNRASWLSEKLYPLHSAKVGGLAMKLAMTLSGLTLALLGGLATYSFWARRASRSSRRRKVAGALRPAPASPTIG